MSKFTHLISLDVGVDTTDKYDSVLEVMADTAKTLEGSDLPYIKLSSAISDESVDDSVGVDETRITENTMYMVYQALKENGHTDEQVSNIITAIQNKGILFRERV